MANNKRDVRAQVLDCTGYPVPEKAMPYWQRRQEINNMLQPISDLETLTALTRQADDKLFAEVNLKALLLELSSVHKRLSLAMPYAVCPMCQGRLPEQCKCCNGRGVISKFKYDHAIPAEIKKARKK